MTTTNTASQLGDAEMTIRDGAELKRVLRVSGYSQREIADYIGYSRSYVNAVCNGCSPLTLRVVEGVRQRLGESLYNLAIKRARQVEVEERRRYEERLRFDAVEAEYQRQQAQLREDRRRQAAMERLHQEINSTAVASDATSALSTSDSSLYGGIDGGTRTEINGDDEDTFGDATDSDVDFHGPAP